MALPIAHAQRMHREALLLRKRDDGGGIHAPGQQNNGFFMTDQAVDNRSGKASRVGR